MATIRIMSGGAPKEIFRQLTPQFERQSGHKVEYVFAVMSALGDKLAAGEKADVLVMPTNILDGYQKDGTVLAQHRAILGLVSVNAVVKTGACHARCDAERHAYGEIDRAAWHRRRDEGQDHPPSGA
jgi:ABC-type molybdate transport system substrate-binding protein